MTRSELYLMLTEALAAAKPETRNGHARHQWEVDCGHIATALSVHHEGFDRERFLMECAGVVETERPQPSAELVQALFEHARIVGRPCTIKRLVQNGAVSERPSLQSVPPERFPQLHAAFKQDLEKAKTQVWCRSEEEFIATACARCSIDCGRS